MMNSYAALADPTRREIIEMLTAGERPAGEIAARFPVSPAAVSQHLKVLREARLVRARIDGQRRLYALNPAGFAEIDSWLARVMAVWEGRLDALDAAIQAELSEDGAAPPTKRDKPRSE